MRVLGIDPGPVESAFALLDTDRLPLVLLCGRVQNEKLLRLMLPEGCWSDDLGLAGHLVVERMTPRALAPAGRDVYDTQEWAGIFRGAFAARLAFKAVTTTTRPTVCAWATGSSRATKAQVAAGIADLWGLSPRQATAKGGPLAGLTHACDTWDAAACALWWLLTAGGYQVGVTGRLERMDTPASRQRARMAG